METKLGTGFLERGFFLLENPDTIPNFSAFLRRYGQRLFRLEDLNIAAPELIDRFLLETPLSMLCSGAPPLHQWWRDRDKLKEEHKEEPKEEENTEEKTEELPPLEAGGRRVKNRKREELSLDRLDDE